MNTKLLKNKYFIPAIICLVLFIPFALNILLQCNFETPIAIIGEKENAPVIWLQFWGAYLAAIGSLIMAIIAWKQAIIARNDNKKLREQNVKITQYEKEQLNYNLFEKQVIEDTKLYSAKKFCSIYYLCKDKKFDVARLACYKLCDDLNLSSIKAARYYKESPIIYQRYLERLKEYNIAILDYSSKVLNCLVKYVENDNIEILQQELEKICNDVHSFYNKFSNNETLSNIGFYTLICQKKIMYETLNEIKKLDEI